MKHKVLIGTVEYGNGHTSVANSLKILLEQNGYEVIVDNPHYAGNKTISRFIEHWYSNVMTNIIYKTSLRIIFSLGSKNRFDHNPFFFVMDNGSQKLIDKYKPDIYIHAFPFQRKKKSAVPHLIMITDYEVMAPWVHYSFDEYLVAHQDTKDQMVRDFKIDPNLINISGIPIHPKFFKKVDRNEIIKKYNLAKDKTKVLITFGAYGKVNIKKVVKNFQGLVNQNQYLVVCGKNKKLYETLKAEFANDPKFIIFPYIDYMHELMHAADLMISKAGGISVTEAIYTKTPIIINEDESIPFPECYNIAFIKRHKLGIISNNKNIIDDINQMAQDDKYLEKCRANMAFVKVDDQKQIILNKIKGLIDNNE